MKFFDRFRAEPYYFVRELNERTDHSCQLEVTYYYYIGNGERGRHWVINGNKYACMRLVDKHFKTLEEAHTYDASWAQEFKEWCDYRQSLTKEKEWYP